MDECDARQRSGFFGSLNDTAIIRAMFPNNIFVPNIRSVHTQIILRLRNKRADVQALIDSGATKNSSNDSISPPSLYEDQRLPEMLTECLTKQEESQTKLNSKFNTRERPK